MSSRLRQQGEENVWGLAFAPSRRTSRRVFTGKSGDRVSVGWRFGDYATGDTQFVRWDVATGGARVPPGLYWARLEVAGKRFVRKVMHL
jgi:hypothetical protein